MAYYLTKNDELKHFGIKGQKWGVRRFENEDGTLTPEGKERYRVKAEKLERDINNASVHERVYDNIYKTALYKAEKYRKESKKNPAKNIFVSLGRKLTQSQLDRNVKDAKEQADIGRAEVRKCMKKINEDPNLEMAVLLADIWGLPYDVYSVGLKDSKKINDYNELNRVYKVYEEDLKNK